MAAAVLLALAVGGLLASGTLSGGDGESSSGTETSADPGSKPTETEVRSLVQTFADIYGSKDPAGLERILTPDFMQRQGSDTVDRKGAIDQYRKQIRRLESPSLALDIDSIQTKKREATAQGRAILTANNAAPEGGDISFHVVKVQSTLLIDGITLKPDG